MGCTQPSGKETGDEISAAHKARALARVDAAVAANQITGEHAGELIAEIEDAEFPGYGAPGNGMDGRCGGFGGPRGMSAPATAALV